MQTKPKQIIINVPSITVRKPTKQDLTSAAKSTKSWLSRTLSKAAKALED